MIFFSGARSRSALPMLLNSEPNFINEIVGDESPSFSHRWGALMRIMQVMKSAFTLMNGVYSDNLRLTGRDITDYIFGFYDIILIKDHPAFSFPYLTPPNTFYLGASLLEDFPVNPLPDIYQKFISNCPHEHIIFMSFGTYLEDITKFPKTKEILDSFKDMKMCIILKNAENIGGQFGLRSNQLLQQTWLPQKSLLSSGKVNFFISHCGNNGRLESIYYNVPLLCIPLFGDQYHNARLVARNNFGLYITREDLNTASFVKAVNVMITNEAAFKLNLKEAMEIARNDPGAGKKVLKFYSDLLINRGSADFLSNKIITKQWYYEILNLDIAGLLLLVTFTVVLMLALCICKCLKCLFTKGMKMKPE